MFADDVQGENGRAEHPEIIYIVVKYQEVMIMLGLALGSGSVRGYSHIPIIQRLISENIEFDYIAGTSVGAIIGAYYSLYGELDSLIYKVPSKSKREFLSLIDVNNHKKSLVKGQKLKKFFEDEFFKNATFKDLKVPMVICATDLNEKKPFFFDRGPLIDAIMASICLPGIFPPYKIGNRFFIDGGALNPVPSQILFEKGMQKVIAVNLNTFDNSVEKDDGMLNVLITTFGIMMNELAKKCLNENTYLLEPRFAYDFRDSLRVDKWKEYYKPGKKVIDENIDQIKTWLKKA